MRLEIKMRGRTLHRTPDIRRSNPGWGDEDFRDIESVALPLPTGHRIVLAGFEGYNFFVEASAPLAGGGSRIEAFWLCGRLDGVVRMFGVWPRENKVVRTMRRDGQEWGGGPTRGWRTGVRAGKQIFAVVEG